MFIEVNDVDNISYVVNTDHIAFIKEDRVQQLAAIVFGGFTPLMTMAITTLELERIKKECKPVRKLLEFTRGDLGV